MKILHAEISVTNDFILGIFKQPPPSHHLGAGPAVACEKRPWPYFLYCVFHLKDDWLVSLIFSVVSMTCTWKNTFSVKAAMLFSIVYNQQHLQVFPGKTDLNLIVLYFLRYSINNEAHSYIYTIKYELLWCLNSCRVKFFSRNQLLLFPFLNTFSFFSLLCAFVSLSLLFFQYALPQPLQY